MHFVSYAFLVLSGLVLAVRFTLGRRKTEPTYLVLLLVASLVFYAWHVPAYLAIILTSTVVDYFAAILLDRAAEPHRRKLVLTVSLVVNLGMLGFFKYTDFFLVEVQRLFGALGLQLDVPTLGLVLPMGISFYTFQSMSYTIDVYRGHLAPYRSFWKFLLFVSFFPQLMAGPIVRAREFLYQIDRVRTPHMAAVTEGVYLVCRGYFLKMVCADNLGFFVTEYWDGLAEPGATRGAIFFVSVLFSWQVFCDFAGYSSIARGLGYLLGFRLPLNFDAPYLCCSFREYWARWHMSLGRWIRDYLYIGLGGSRRGYAIQLRNLFLVMFLMGLWHGAANTIVLWGTVHAVVLTLERFFGLHDPKGWKALGWFCFVHLLITVNWWLFRAVDLEQTRAIWSNALGSGSWSLEGIPVWTGLALVAAPLVMHLRTLAFEKWSLPLPGPREKAVLTALMLYASLTCYGVSNDFIYFQF